VRAPEGRSGAAAAGGSGRPLTGRRRAALPAGDRAHGDEHRPCRLGVGDVQDLAGPPRAEPGGQLPAQPREVDRRREVARPQRHLVAGRDDLAEQGRAQDAGSSERTTAAGP
jgi:hypothetical protein